MNNSGIYVGLDIGTTSIKAIVCENVKGQLNVVGSGSQPSAGLNRGIIVDIDKTAQAIKSAVEQAQEKTNVKINDVVVGLPANFLKIEKIRGMITVADQNQSREITDQDVVEVAKAALTQNLAPEREVIDLLPQEFIVDGFDQIKDPRGMVGVRLELHASLFTGPKTVVHNTRKAVQKAGLNVIDMVATPLATGLNILNDGEQDFGTVVIDMGGGQTTASVIHDHQLKYTHVDPEGGDFITKDISIVLNTSQKNAEKLKRDYGFADSKQADEGNVFTVDVVGQSKPTEVSEQYLAQIIEARVMQILERLRDHLSAVRALDLPGGIVLTGGVAALPGIVDLASYYFKVNVKTFVPNQMGIRHPMYTQGLSLAQYEASLGDIDLLIKQALYNSATPRTSVVQPKPVQKTKKAEASRSASKRSVPNNNEAKPTRKAKVQEETPRKEKQPKKDRLEGVKNFFNNFFD